MNTATFVTFLVAVFALGMASYSTYKVNNAEPAPTNTTITVEAPISVAPSVATEAPATPSATIKKRVLPVVSISPTVRE